MIFLSEDIKSLTKLQERSNPAVNPSVFGKGLFIGGSPGGTSFHINNTYAEKVSVINIYLIYVSLVTLHYKFV